MAFTIRPLHTDEQKYTYRQSTQIEGQTGSIGYLRGDFGSGKEFFSSWFDHRRDLKTDKFKSELDEVINALRSEEYGLLKSRTDMTQYAAKYPDSAFQGNYATEYGFRADTEKYSFLIRCNPARGDYNFTATAMCGNGSTAIWKRRAVESALLRRITKKNSKSPMEIKSALP